MRPHAPSGSVTPAVSDMTGDYLVLPDWSPFISRLVRLSRESRDFRAPSLKSRDEGTHAPRGQRRPCVSDVRGLVCLPSGSATPAVSDGTGDKPRTLPLSHATGPVWTGQRRCRDVPPKVLIFERLPGQRRGEPRALLTSRVARSRLALNPEAVACKDRSAQGQTLLTGDLDSWPGLVCPGTRIDKSISERVGCRGYTEKPSQP